MYTACQHKRVLVFDTLSEYAFNEVKDSKFTGIKRVNPISYTSQDENDSELFNKINEFVFRHGNMLYVIDEVDFYVTANRIPFSFAKLFRYGRHKNIDLITITRRPAEIPRITTAMTDKFLIFRLHEPNDLEYFKKLSSTLPDKIKSLEKFKFLTYET